MRIFAIIVFVLFIAANSFAATAGSTSDTKVPYGPGISNMQAQGLGPFKLSFDADCILERDVKGSGGTSDGDYNGQWYLGRLGYTMLNDRVEPYFRVGASNVNLSWKQGGHDIKAQSEIGIAGGVGIKALVFEIPEHRLRFSVDGQYRYTDPNIKKAKVDVPGRTVSATEFKVSEWQISGLISMEFPLNYDKNDSAALYSIIPYLGVAYSDCDIKSKFTYEGTEYDIGSGESDNKFLLITGCDLTSPKDFALSVEGRWIGETAVSGGCTAKF